MAVFAVFRGGALERLIENPLILSPLVSWFMAQTIKAVILLTNRQKRSVRAVLFAVVWRTGGMPSSHAALVSSLTTSVALREGVGSGLFAVAFWFALVTIRDAVGVRRATGIQARSINALGKSASDKLGIDFRPVKEVEGHTPRQVIAGTLLGVCVAAALPRL
ncbi:MAG: divergent PAP2 family protein [Treponematales bacterium]